ncbi:hypothetical protein GCM10010123_29790 [Pilimelia anulata]|uniref:PepSY domain-containing protein n=1 Tax=Pilimelia anulata TaxID=53371 RepID=A0A8J3BCG8_9ACTN|nr:hypothetical protein [Pilimelia anulata]GGJ97757.1 hypothetical protein GCM10010123_29790 [Pilimelia anulata]
MMRSRVRPALLALAVGGCLAVAGCADGDATVVPPLAGGSPTASAEPSPTLPSPPPAGDGRRTAPPGGDAQPPQRSPGGQSGTPCTAAERAGMFPTPTPYRGLTVDALRKRLGAKAEIRVVGADNECYVVTTDLRPGRVNVYLEKGRIAASDTE